MEAEKEFRKLLTRLTPATAYNETCVKHVRSFNGDLQVLFNALIAEMNRSSLNSRVKQLNFLEYCAGIVGNCVSQHEWNALVAQNLQRVVDAAIPAHLAPPALVNVIPTTRFVNGYYRVGLIDENTCRHIVDQIKSKEQTLQILGSSRNYQVNKDEVLRRMEDDRERAKKYKERKLAIVPGSDAEFERLWEIEPMFSKDMKEPLRRENQMAGLS